MLWKWIRIVFTLASILIVYKVLATPNLLTGLHRINWTWFGVALICALATMFAQTLRWRVLIKPLVPQARVSFFGYFRHISIGYFANIFLPSSVGGDVVRTLTLGKEIGAIEESVASIVLARILGVVALLSLFWVFIPFSGFWKNSNPTIVLAMSILTVLSIIGFVVLFKMDFQIKSRAISSTGFWARLFEKLRNIAKAFILFKHHPGAVISGWIYSLPIQALTILQGYSSFMAIGGDISLIDSFVGFPVLIIATMVPLTVFNVGVKEAVTIFVFQLVGATSDHSIGATLVGYFIALFQALIGLVFFLSLRQGRRG